MFYKSKKVFFQDSCLYNTNNIIMLINILVIKMYEKVTFQQGFKLRTSVCRVDAPLTELSGRHEFKFLFCSKI